jgi:hypothetical protein
MKLTAHQLHEMSYQFVSGARHRAASAWCDTAMFSIKPNTTHQRSQEPSPG